MKAKKKKKKKIRYRVIDCGGKKRDCNWAGSSSGITTVKIAA